MGLTQQGNRNAIKTKTRVKARLITPNHALSLDRAAQSSQYTTQDHGKDHSLRHNNACIAGCIWINADRANFKADGRFPQQPPDDERR